MSTASRYDAIVIGGGHNGLVAANYLARGGLRTLVLERYHEVGGAAITEEQHPGFHLSTGSYVLSLAPRKIFDDLGIWSRIELLERNPRFFAPFPDGSSLTYWLDEAKWLEQIRRISPRDADAWHHYDDFMERACAIMDDYVLRRPPSWGEVASRFGGDDALLLQKIFFGSAADISEHFFDSYQLRSLVAASGLIGTFRGPRDVGSGYNKLYHTLGMVTGRRGAWAYVRGAMGAVTQALAATAVARGVEIRRSAEVARIVVEHGRATGVELVDGQRFAARVVLSNADPARTYLRLVSPDDLPPAYRRQIEGIKMDSPVMKINLATRELPRFWMLPDDQQMQGSSGGLFVAPSVDDVQRACNEAKLGAPSTSPFMNIHMQSAVDRTIAPDGMHTISIFSQYFPYTLADGAWEERREAIADHVVAEFAKFAPNIPDAVLYRQVLAPPDLEARFGLTGGHIFQGDHVPEQAFDMRPVAGSSSYQGPIDGLYLCGSGAWPGGCVMGAPGHNAAHEILERHERGALPA